MEITRFDDARPYPTVGHFDMTALRLQGHEASGSTNFWVGFSTFEPGGGAEMGSTPFEKVYVVVEGELAVTTSAGTVTLGRYDSCRIAPGEARAIRNETSSQVRAIVIIPYA